MFKHMFCLETTIVSLLSTLLAAVLGAAIFVPSPSYTDITNATEVEKNTGEAITITVPICVEYEITSPTINLRSDKKQEIVSLGKPGGTFVSLTEHNYDLKQGEGMMIQMQYFCIGVKTKAFIPGEEKLSFEAATDDYAVSDIEIEDEDGLVKITGVITNNTVEDVTTDNTICVYAVFYDSEGDVLGLGYTVVDNVEAGGKTCFVIGSYYEVEEYVG